MSIACSFCDAKCCKSFLITISVFDALRISERTGKKPEEFCELAFPDILNLKEDNLISCKEGYFVLALRSRPCIFLGKNNSCSIFEFAPLACRAYPSKPMSSICPAPSKVVFVIKGNDGELVRKGIIEMEEYAKIVKRLNGRRLKKEDYFKDLFEEGRLIYKKLY